MLNIVSIRKEQGNAFDRIRLPEVAGGRSLIVVTYGCCPFRMAHDGRLLTLEKGHLLLLQEEAICSSDSGTLHEKWVVTFHTGCLDYFPMFGMGPILYGPTSRYELIVDRLHRMEEQWLEKPLYYKTMMAALLVEILVQWGRELDAPAAPAKFRMAEQMKAFIRNHYREQITKEELGAFIGRSPNYCASLLKEVTGQTIGDHLHAARIKTAIDLLRHSELTVGDIAEFVGYKDVSYFHRVFNRIMGATPSNFMVERGSL